MNERRRGLYRIERSRRQREPGHMCMARESHAVSERLMTVRAFHEAQAAASLIRSHSASPSS